MTARPFFDDVEEAHRTRAGLIDVHTAWGSAGERRPAVVFVHGGPVPAGRVPRPRDSPIFHGYGALAAAAGLVGITFDHSLYTDEHYPQAAEDVVAAVERARGHDAVDPDRIVLWFFSGGGPLAAQWLLDPPRWLRAVAWTYPVLAPPPDRPGDIPRFDAISALAAAPALPTLLVRAGRDYPPLITQQDTFVATAKEHGAALEVIELPDAQHGFEAYGADDRSRAAVTDAMGWVRRQT